jgi:Zn-dependent protease with chaperone function
VLGGVGVVLLTAAAIYWLTPTWKIRRGDLQPFVREDDPELVDEVAEMARQAGLPAAPTILVDASMSPSGLAFGRWGRHFLVLNAGLVMQFAFDRPAFRAVVLHELAHLRNGDVDKTYFSLAVAGSFLVVAVGPHLIGLASAPGSLGNIFNELWRTVVMLGVVYGSVIGILRARELYADVRASAWEGSDGALRRILGSLEPVARGWQSLVALHPDPAARQEAVDRPQRLLGLGFGEALAVGIAATMAYPDVTLMLGLLTSGQKDVYFYSPVASGLVFGLLVSAIVGTGIWRATLASLRGGEYRLRAGRITLGLAIGMILGLQMSLTASIQHANDPLTPAALVVNAIWVVALVVSLRLFIAWMHIAARSWLTAALDHSSPRVPFWVVLGITAVLLGSWLSLLLNARDFALNAATEDVASQKWLAQGLAYILGILQQPTTVAGLLALWAVPVAARWWRPAPAPAGESRWFWLDRSSRPLGPERRNGVSLRRALGVALVGALAFTVALVGTRQGLRSVVAASRACPAPAFVAVPSELVQGDVLEFEGRGFTPGSSVSLMIRGPSPNGPMPLLVNDSGEVTGTISTDASDTQGTYVIEVTGPRCGTSDSVKVSANMTIR